MNTEKQLKKLAKTFVKADECLDRKTAQKLITKANKIRAKLDKQSLLLTMSTVTLLSLFSGFSVGCIAATLIIR